RVIGTICNRTPDPRRHVGKVVFAHGMLLGAVFEGSLPAQNKIDLLLAAVANCFASAPLRNLNLAKARNTLQAALRDVPVAKQRLIKAGIVCEFGTGWLGIRRIAMQPGRVDLPLLSRKAGSQQK